MMTNVSRRSPKLVADERSSTDTEGRAPWVRANMVRDRPDETVPVASDSDDGRATARRRASGWLGRYVGLVIAGIAVGAALLLWFAVSAGAPAVDQSPRSRSGFGGWGGLSYTPPPAPPNARRAR